MKRRLAVNLFLLLSLFLLTMSVVFARQQTTPGVGAYTEDPKKILRTSQEAIGKLTQLSYEADYKATGSFATRSSVSAGKVKLAKLEQGNSLKAKLAAEGMYYPAGESAARPFRVAFSGKTVFRVRESEKVLVEKPLIENDPKERELGFVTGLLGAGANQLLMFEYILDEPFARQIAGEVLEYEGKSAVGDVLCHVIYVEFDRQTNGRVRRQRWFIGVKDNLPRKSEIVVVDDKGRFGAYTLTLSKLQVDVPIKDSAFAIQLPKGYKVKPYEEAKRQPLLALGEIAPDWKLNDAKGKPHSLSDYKDKVVVLDFWATWCGPCVRTMPEIEALHKKFQKRGVEVFGINLWEESNAVAYFEEKKYTYKLLLNGEPLAKAYHVNVLPTIYIIGVSGEIIYSGTVPENNLTAIIEKYLTERGM